MAPEWEEIVYRYGSLLYSTAWRILRNRHDVEDVVQEVLFEAWRLRNEHDVTQWGGWLRKLALCRALDRLRSRKFEPSLGESDLAVGDSQLCDLERQEVDTRLRQAVALLPERDRLVFSLRYFELMSNSAIAELLSLSSSAVSTSLYRARVVLGRQLVDVLPERKDNL